MDREGSALAYQVIGEGPINVVAYFEIVQHLDLLWTDPDVHRNYERTAGFARQVHFQRRGFGLSEQVPYIPTLEQHTGAYDEVVQVMTEGESAIGFGVEGGKVSDIQVFAAGGFGSWDGC